jgi:hypothetical protein
MPPLSSLRNKVSPLECIVFNWVKLRVLFTSISIFLALRVVLLLDYFNLSSSFMPVPVLTIHYRITITVIRKALPAGS